MSEESWSSLPQRAIQTVFYPGQCHLRSADVVLLSISYQPLAGTFGAKDFTLKILGKKSLMGLEKLKWNHEILEHWPILTASLNYSCPKNSETFFSHLVGFSYCGNCRIGVPCHAPPHPVLHLPAAVALGESGLEVPVTTLVSEAQRFSHSSRNHRQMVFKPLWT